MSALDRLALSTLDALARADRGRKVASRLDLLRSTGPRHAAHRLRTGLGQVELSPGVRFSVYARIWNAAAAALGADAVEELPGGFLEIRRGRARTRVWQQYVPLDDTIAMSVALDKRVVHRLLSAVDLPVPEHLECPYDDVRAAQGFLERQSGPCVVKAAHGTGGGAGTTCGVTTAEDLRRARMRAGRRADTLLIEREAPGAVYRLLFLEGELLDVVRQDHPTVEGNGRSTVDELIEAENRRRVAARGDAGTAPLRVDLDCVLTLSRAGLTLGSVLASGERRTVKMATNEARVEDCHTARADVCDELVHEARRAASAVGLRLAGVDVVTADPSRPLRGSEGVILEVNGGPALHRHYQVADVANVRAVAEPVLARLLDGRDVVERAPRDAPPYPHRTLSPR